MRALILAGRILVDDVPVDKAGAQVADKAEVRLKGEPMRFVSRGGCYQVIYGACSSAYRQARLPGTKSANQGIRPSRSLQ